MRILASVGSFIFVAISRIDGDRAKLISFEVFSGTPNEYNVVNLRLTWEEYHGSGPGSRA